LTNVKAFRIHAGYMRAKKRINISRDVLAINKNAALEKFFSELGRHGIKRYEVEIMSIKEIDPLEIKNPKLRKIVLTENPVVYIED